MTQVLPAHPASANKVLRIFRLPRLMKLGGFAKLFKFKSLIKGTEFSLQLKLYSGLLKTLRLCLLTVFGLHLAACIFCALPLLENDPPESWVFRMGLQDKPPATVYLTAYYFCFVTLTTVGFGDVKVHTNRSIS